MKKTGAQIIADLVWDMGVRITFGLPGSHNVELYDALKERGFRNVLTTSELSAGFMADAYSRVSGRVGVCVTIPGPGLTYLLTGLAEAYLDSSPLVALVAGIRSDYKQKFQIHEIPQGELASPVVKDVVRIESFDEIPLMIANAFEKSQSGEPGPVVVEIPSNFFRERGEQKPRATAKPEKAGRFSDYNKISTVVELIKQSRRCGIYAGKGAFCAAEEVKALSEKLSIPVCTTIAGRGVVPEDHPLSVGFGFGPTGNPFAREIFEKCDLIIGIGCKFSETSTGAWDLKIPENFIHIDQCEENLNVNFSAKIAICGDVGPVLREILNSFKGVTGKEDKKLVRKIRDRKETFYKYKEPVVGGRGVRPENFFLKLREHLDRDSIVVTDTGMHQFFALSCFQVLQLRTFITPTDFQAMGFAIPAAIAAKLCYPDKKVVTICGDGCFLFTGFELLTAVREGINLLTVIFNDGSLGLIEDMQKRIYGRTEAVKLQNPDYKMLAMAFGMDYFSIENSQQIDSVLEKSLKNKRATLLEIAIDYSVLPRYIRQRFKTAAKRMPLPEKIYALSRILRRSVKI